MIEEKKKFRSDFSVPRTVLLFEVERYCRFCQKRNAVGLTKTEVAEYEGFECESCKNFNEDRISSNELPVEWQPTTN